MTLHLYNDFKNTIKQNLYFILPLMLWGIVGAGLLISFNRTILFFCVNQKGSQFLDILNTIFSAFGRGDVIPFILLSLLLIPAYRNKNYVFTTLSFGIVIPFMIFFAKDFFNTPRPLKYYGIDRVHTVPWLDNLFENSFPSGHTLGAFGFFMLLSLYLPKSLKPFSIFFFILALACGYSRMYLGQHFFADVYAGSMVGAILSLMLYVLGARLFPISNTNIK